MANISKLTPILYKKNETDFNHNGLGKLTNLLANEIEEVLNGEFEAFFEYPANGRLANKIDNKMLIKARPNRKDEPHIFRIYEYELDITTQTYLIYARSKNIDDLAGNVIKGVNVRNSTPQQAWNLAKNSALEPVETTFYSDIDTRSSVEWENRSLLSIVAGQEGSMIQWWGGEIKHGNNWLWLYRRRGQDNVATVRHGKNLKGLNATYSTKGLITAIVPFYTERDHEKDTTTLIYGNTVKSQYVNNYPHVYHEFVEFNSEELDIEHDDELTHAQIRTKINNVAKNWFKEHENRDLPSINMKIDLEDISQTKEYAKFKDFEQIEIGDTITVYAKKYDVHLTAKVRRVVYDGLTDKNKLVEIGTVARSIYDDYKDLVNNTVDKSKQELQEGIDYVMVSANGKNKNYYGTADPNEVELVANNGDTYFRTNGQYKQLWIFRDGQWFKEIDTEDIDKVAKEVEEAQKEIAEAKDKANEAVDKINGEIADKFTSLDKNIVDLDTLANTAQINANKAIDDAYNAYYKATQVENDVTSLNITIDELEGSLSFKADKTTVEEISNVVNNHTLDIQANAEGLNLKADSSRVDTLSGNVDNLGAEIGVVAGEIALKADKTVVDGLKNIINGQNLLPDFYDDRWEFDARTTIIDKYTLQVGNLGLVGEIELTNLSPGKHYLNGEKAIGFCTNTGNGWSSRFFEGIIEVPSDGKLGIRLDAFSNPASYEKLYLLWGEEDTGWTPPGGLVEKVSQLSASLTIESDKIESLVTRVGDNEHSINQVVQTADANKATISNHTGKISALEQDVNGLQSTVSNKAEQSQVTQLANLVNTKVSNDEYQAQISTLANNINLRVEKDNVIAQINLSEESILLDAKRVHIGSSTTIDDGIITNRMVAVNAELDGAKIQNATIGSAKIIGLDVDKISGNITEFIQSNWNNVSGGNVNITGSGILTTASNGSQIQIANGMVYVRNSAGNNLGQFGFVREPNSPATHYIRIRTSLGTNFAINQTYNSNSDRKDTLWLRIAENGQATMELQSRIQMNREGIYFSDNTRQESGSIIRINNTLRVVGPQGGSGNSVAFYGGTGGSSINIAYSIRTYADGVTLNKMWANLDMSGNTITGNSDIRLKTDIVYDEINSLEAIKKWKMAGFNWKDPSRSTERHFGVIAQSAPEIAFTNRGDEYLSIDFTKQVNMTAHAVQQLALREENTNKVASQALVNSETNAQKIERLEKRIEDLEGVA